MITSPTRTLPNLLTAFQSHPLVLVALKSPGSRTSYASTIRRAINLKAGQELPALPQPEDFLEQVRQRLGAPRLSSNQGSALRLFHQTLIFPLTIAGGATPARSVWPLAPASAATTGTIVPVTLTQSVTIARDYMRRQFIGRLESQERYYPNLFRKQPAHPAVCLRYPAMFFRYQKAPTPIRQAATETIEAATDRITFHVAGVGADAPAAVRAVPFSAVQYLEVVPVPATAGQAASVGAHVLVHCPAANGQPAPHQLMQRLHTGPGQQFEPFHLSAQDLARAATKGPVDSAAFARYLFTRVSLDHVCPFTDTLRTHASQLTGLQALTALISSQPGAPALGTPNARYFDEQRPIYRSLCQPGSLSAVLTAKIVADIRFLASQVELEILSISRNSQRGANSLDD